MYMLMTSSIILAKQEKLLEEVSTSDRQKVLSHGMYMAIIFLHENFLCYHTGLTGDEAGCM